MRDSACVYERESAWAVLRVGRCWGQRGDDWVRFLVMGGQWAALCLEVARWDCVGCAVWWYVLGCPEAGAVFPDGEALEGRRCWEVDRAVLVKGLPYLSPQCSDFQLVDFPDCGFECGHA